MAPKRPPDGSDIGSVKKVRVTYSWRFESARSLELLTIKRFKYEYEA